MTDENQIKESPVEDPKSLKEYREELIAAGMPAEDAERYQTKGQAKAILSMMKAKEVVKRVDSLEDKEDPKEKKIFDTQYKTKLERMRDHLMSQPMVRVKIPLEGSEKKGVVEWRTNKSGQKYQFHVSGAVLEPQFNGFKFLIPKGVAYDVPQQVSDQLDKSEAMTSSAGEDIAATRIDPATGRPMDESL
jgi:hypothetical protein